MPSKSFDPVSLFAPNLPAPAQRWNGFPEFNFVGGNNDAEGVPVTGLIDAATKVLQREGKTLATYSLNSGPQGYLPLREFVAGKVRKQRGIRCSADDVLITSGSLQGIDLVNELFLAPGDTVLIEQFTYGGALSRLKRRGINMVGIPLDEQGLRTDMLAATLEDLKSRGIKPKYIYTIPTVQNPTSSVMGEQRRLELLRIAADYGVLVFEDECYADLLWNGERPPALRALDDHQLVVHIGSFSKSIAPALRVGYVVADWTVLSHMLACKTDAGSGALEQMVLAEYCTEHFDNHVTALNRLLKRKAQTLTDALGEYFGTAAEFSTPDGGIFLWVKLPEEVDTLALSQLALKEGIAFNPGPEWSTDAEPAKSSLRICFANPTHDNLRAGVARLAELCARETGIPSRIANVEQS
jgi:2-aminoadipate transaminase